jgi:hypothetical protein
MLGLARKTDKATAVRSEVAAFLYDLFSAENSALAGLDRWTQRRVTDESMAKIALVLEADDPVVSCYQNMVREIDKEAENGIYRVSPAAKDAELRELSSDPGLSGKLRFEMHKIAPDIFANELRHSDEELDLVWASIETRYDLAKVNASVSEIVMRHIAEDVDSVADMSMALRSLMYSYHEDRVRRRSGLPVTLNERSARELSSMIADLTERAGNA